jgi:2-polyprenyl-6-hydroxyphenyl methylase/3-demethylubiquinone-9 3-methyltransferase
MKNTLNKTEIEKFSSIADEWWDKNGKFKPLHKFNPLRIDYILKKTCQIKKFDFYKNKPLTGLKHLDVGCGGGLIAEPIDMLGANVTAIDPSEKNIKTAKAHQLKSKSKVNYLCSSIEALDKKQKFDIITCLEVIEHVDNPDYFIREISKHLNKNGILFIATINRTAKSLLLAKFAAEYILKWLPTGTHDWRKFLKPSEITEFLKNENLALHDLSGMNLNILKNSWEISSDISQNFIICFKK